MRINRLATFALLLFLYGCEYRVTGCDGPVCVHATTGVDDSAQCELDRNCACPSARDVNAAMLREVSIARRLYQSCHQVQPLLFPNMTFDQTLDTAATDHAVDMARYRFESVIGSDGLDVYDRVQRRAGSGFSLDVELAQLVNTDAFSAYDAVEAWLISDTQCAVLMSDRYSHLGAACARGTDGRIRWSLVLGGA
ncbi:MAG: CAP domain-containing protein [Granulosicoccaceae bacterium]